MRELPKQLWALIARLLPKQENSGSGSIQVGKAGGNVTIMNITQHVAPVALVAPQVRSRAPATADHRQVLALMDHLPDRIPVLDFMEREFSTRMVIHLDAPQLYRLRRYVEVILNKGKQ